LFSLFEISELCNDITQLHDVMEPIFRLIKFIEEPVHRHLASRSMGRIFYNYCLFVDMHLSPTEQIHICYAIESEVICVAQSRGFSADVTNNTNLATQVSVGYTEDINILYLLFIGKDPNRRPIRLV